MGSETFKGAAELVLKEPQDSVATAEKPLGVGKATKNSMASPFLSTLCSTPVFLAYSYMLIHVLI